MIDTSNLLPSDNLGKLNLQDDLRIKGVQQNLIRMGFDIEMVNKIISIFKIRSEEEALNYLIKEDDGLWNHPFIPKIIDSDELNNGILEQPKAMMSSVLTRINSLGMTNTIQRTSSFIKPNNDLESGEIKIEENICDICGEPKEFHRIKEFIAPNINSNNNLFKIQNNTNNINTFLSDDKNDEEMNSLLNNIDNNKININKEEEKKVEEEKEEQINENECLICMGDLENPIEIEKCKHKFCEECLNSYLVNLINHNRIDQIPCPKNKCSNKQISEEFFSQYLSEQEYFKYRQFKAQNEIARDSKKIFCPLCDSYASIEGITEKYDSNNPNYQKSVLKCQKGHEFCSCGRPLHEKECYQDEKEFKDFLNQEKIKKCPKCGFLIKKNKGCNHMTCGNPICRYEFCWLCMKEAVPNHFDYGPCAGKQFFDPDSFSSRLQRSNPCLYCIYSFFRCILALILLVIGFLLVPGLGFSFISFEVIFEHDTFEGKLNKIYIKFTMFMICFFVFLCIQSIAYMLWYLAFLVLGIIIGIILLVFIITIIKKFLKCIFCHKKENNEVNDIYIGEEIELGDNINNENNQNKENNENIENNKTNENNQSIEINKKNENYNHYVINVNS